MEQLLGHIAQRFAENFRPAAGIVAEQAMNGYVDYLTRDDTGSPKATIEKAMTDAGIVWHLDTVQYENDTGYIHYTWEYHEYG